jgi:hypothetical protein
MNTAQALERTRAVIRRQHERKPFAPWQGRRRANIPAKSGKKHVRQYPSILAGCEEISKPAFTSVLLAFEETRPAMRGPSARRCRTPGSSQGSRMPNNLGCGSAALSILSLLWWSYLPLTPFSIASGQFIVQLSTGSHSSAISAVSAGSAVHLIFNARRLPTDDLLL